MTLFSTVFYVEPGCGWYMWDVGGGMVSDGADSRRRAWPSKGGGHAKCAGGFPSLLM